MGVKSILENDCEPIERGNRASDDKPLEALFRGEKHRASPTPSPQENGGGVKKHPLEWIIAFMVFGTLIATSVAAWYTKKQWETASDQEMRTLRAYFIIKDIAVVCKECGDVRISPTPPESTSNTISILIENTGQTPGHKTDVKVSWYPVQGTGPQVRLPDDFGFQDVIRDPAAFRSHGDIGKDHFKLATGPIEDQDIPTFRDADTKKYSVFIYGHIDYCDVFNEPHSTAFCYKYIKNAGTNIPLCDRYNGEIRPKHRC